MSKIDEVPNSYKTRTRKRLIPSGKIPVGVEVWYSGSSNTPQTKVKVSGEMCDAQITVSEGHPFWAYFKDTDGIKPDLGGNFSTTRWSPIVDWTQQAGSYIDSRGRQWQASGPYIPSVKSNYSAATNRGWGYISHNTDIDAMASYFPALSNSDNELLAFGTSAIARCRPDNSPLSVTTLLGELLREGIPFRELLSATRLRRLVHEFEEAGVKKGPEKASDFFLENQFGLQPYISDVRKFVNMQQSGFSVLDNLEKNSGKLIRRRYKFPEETFSTTKGNRTSGDESAFTRDPNIGTGSYFLPLGDDIPEYNNFWDVHTTRKCWFSGAFRIYMPKDMEPVSRLRDIANHLRWDYGVDLDFATLWNLAPWSWLLDWELNMGDCLTNISKWSKDAVVLHYGYVMQETKSLYVVNPKPGERYGPVIPGGALPSMGVTVHKKKRIRATPYGFGIAYGSLSVTQKAILAAIGITRF